MYVCSCRGVTDSTVRAAIADGASSIADVARRCGAGSRCGGCWPELHRLLDACAADEGAQIARIPA